MSAEKQDIPRNSPGRHCPACVAASGVTLLLMGKPAMALTVLQDVPKRIRDALAAAYEDGHRDLAVELANGRTATRAPVKRRRARA